MVFNYKPKNYGKEYYEIKGSSQYPMFVATALGIKRSYDDWISVGRYDEFAKICKEYGMYVEPDVVFVNPNLSKKDIVGGENINTTFSQGVRFTGNEKKGEVHVFVSKSKKEVLEAKKCGWYSVVVNGRSVNKPFVDHLRFGRSLGFPSCCVNFFMKYNNWKFYSHPFETFKNTKFVDGKASYHCNNFLMDNSLFYIHHIPCSYKCENTIKYAKKVEQGILDVEPDFVKKTNEILKMPLLVFGERNYVLFDGKMKDGAIDYTNSNYISNPASPEDSFDDYLMIQQGDKLMMNGERLVVMKKDEVIYSSIKKKEWFMIDFD